MPCEFITAISGDEMLRCGEDVVAGSMYCPAHAIEYVIPQHSAEPISGLHLTCPADLVVDILTGLKSEIERCIRLLDEHE